MTRKRFGLRVLTLLGLVLSVLILTMAMLKLVQAQGSPPITITKGPDQTVVSGSTVTFTIAVTNTSDVILTNVTISDTQAANCARVFSYLDPGAGTSYECTRTNVTATFTNTATVTATSPVSGVVSYTDTASVDVIHPDIEIVKTADPTVVYANDGVTYTYTVTNPGDDPLSNVSVSDDRCSPVTFVGGDTNYDGRLDPSETWTYTCSTIVSVDTTNTAEATGTDSASGTVTHTDTAFVDVVDPDISIVKMADPTVVYANDGVTYTYTVTNPGDDPLSNVSVSDDRCSPVTFVGGDTNYDGLLDLSETWTYTCSTTISVDTTNTAEARGTDSASGTVTYTDTAFVHVINPAIEIVKTADPTVAYANDGVTYTYTVTDPGDDPLSNVSVSDDRCSPVTFVGGDTNYDGLLDLSETWTYTCSTTISVDTTNTAEARGTDSASGTVTYTDTAFVDVIAPAIEIAKTPYTQTVASGATVTFTIVVTNTGDVTLTNVTVSDAQATNCVQTFAELLVDEHQSYSCAVANVTDGFINSATASGQPPEGEDVTDADAAKVKLDETQACPSDMLAYWKLDETGSGDYDDFYYGHDGECAGDCPTPVTNGHVNGGQEFNGSSTGIDVPAVPGDDSFNWGAHDSFSIEFWMKADSANSCSPSNEVIVGRDDSSSQLHWWVGIGCGSWANGGAAFVLGDNDEEEDLRIVVGTTDLTDGSWHHIVAIRDGSANENRIYVNGTEEASESATYSAGFDSLTAALNVGWLNLGSHGYHFDGTVDEVALYDRALSANEIRQHYNEGLAGRWYCQGGTYVPIIVSTPVTEATVGRPYIYDVEAAGNPLPTYALITPPNGMTIDPASGLISWTPTVAQEGNHDVEVEASNSEGSATQNFTVVAHEGTLCPTDMLAYWKLDETSGTTYYDFYDGHDGECAGDCPDPATGHLNGGQAFSSTTGIDVPADEDFDWGATDSFSIEFWMRRPGTPTNNEVIVGRQGPTHPRPHIWVGVEQGAGNVAAFCLYDTDGIGTCLTGEAVVTGGDWHHIVAVRDAVTNELRIYVDGEEDGLMEPPPYSVGFDSTTALNIGWLNLGGGFHFNGTVDEVALYNRALSTTEIQQHYDNDGGDGPGYCINPDITVSKMANPSVVYLENMVTYTYTVTSPGDAPLSDVNVSDDQCSPVTFETGDDDSDSRLDPTETWLYQCSMILSADITNTVTVTGTHRLSDTLGDTDTIFVDVIDPEIAVDKTADPMIIYAGDTVTYTYAVANPGDDPLSGVNVSDDKCSPVTFVGGDNNDNYKMDAGEIWTYTCSTALGIDTTNTVIGTATDSAGGPVSDTDMAFVDVRDSTIAILKQANDDSTVFEFTIRYGSNNEPFQLKNGEGEQFSDLAPGSYTVTETVVSEWELLSITCTNGISLIAPDTPAITINLQSEQDVSCTFTNYNKGPADPYPHKIYLPIILKD